MPLAWTASTYDLDSCELLYACITCIPILLGPPVLAPPEAVSSIFLATSISFPHPVAWMIIFRFNFDTISLKRPFIVFALIIRKGQKVVCSMYLFSRNANLLFLHCHNHFVLSKVSSIFLLHLLFVFHIALGHRDISMSTVNDVIFIQYLNSQATLEFWSITGSLKKFSLKSSNLINDLLQVCMYFHFSFLRRWFMEKTTTTIDSSTTNQLHNWSIIIPILLLYFTSYKSQRWHWKGYWG